MDFLNQKASDFRVFKTFSPFTLVKVHSGMTSVFPDKSGNNESCSIA